MRNLLPTIFLISILISCKNRTASELKYDTTNIKTLLAHIDKTELNELQQIDSIPVLWNLLVFEHGGCLSGGQYITEKKLKNEPKPLVFSEMHWKRFAKNDKTKLTDFLIKKLSDTTKTKVHTCPFFGATNGEMAIYALQHIHQKNWFDFSEFKEFKNKAYKSATEQPQIWLQRILTNPKERNKIAKLYREELYK